MIYFLIVSIALNIFLLIFFLTRKNNFKKEALFMLDKIEYEISELKDKIRRNT